MLGEVSESSESYKTAFGCSKDLDHTALFIANAETAYREQDELSFSQSTGNVRIVTSRIRKSELDLIEMDNDFHEKERPSSGEELIFTEIISGQEKQSIKDEPQIMGEAVVNNNSSLENHTALREEAEVDTNKPVPKQPSPKPTRGKSLVYPVFESPTGETKKKPAFLRYPKQIFQKVQTTFQAILQKNSPNTSVETQTVRIAVVGVHGWFPPKWTEPVTGMKQSLGKSSEKLVSKCSEAISHHFRQTLEIDNIHITDIPLLFGKTSGIVSERLDFHYQTLINTPHLYESLYDADVIVFSSHSQGVPVASLLIDKILTEFPDFSSKRVCQICFAGVNHGPFLEIEAFVPKNLGAGALELFKFCDSSSAAYKSFEDATRRNIESGVKIASISSWADEVVPVRYLLTNKFFSAAMWHFDSPAIFRALYISDTEIADEFLLKLVHYVLLLRNAGLSDHGLAPHLSNLVSGSLFNGPKKKAHSALYQDINAHLVAVEFCLGDSPNEPIFSSRRFKPSNLTALNDYELPWIVARLITEGLVSQEIRCNRTLESALYDLVVSFSTWKPTTKVLKEVKYRLNGMASKTLKVKFADMARASGNDFDAKSAVDVDAEKGWFALWKEKFKLRWSKKF